MKRLLTYLLIILNFGLVIKASANEIKFKKIQINTNEVYKKFGRDLIGVIEDAVSYYNRFYEHTEDNNLKGMIEIFSMDTSAYEGQVNIWFRSIAVKSNSKVGCNKSDKSIFFESIDLGNNLACLSIREINKDELSSPNFNKNKHVKFSSRKSNIEKLIKKKQLSVSDRMIRAEHYFYKSGRIRWVFYTKAIDLNSENEVNDFINETFQNHKNFGEQLKIKKTTQLALKDVKIDKTLVVEKKVVDQTPKLVLDNEINEKKIVKNIDEDKKNDEKIIKSASNEKKLKKKVKSSEVNFYKIKQGDYIDNPIVSISKNNKIALPKGIWQVAKKSKIFVWSPTDNIILINQSRADSPSFGEFIEIAVTKTSFKGYPRALAVLKKPCKKKYYFHDLQKTSGSGNTYSCFVSGFVENDIFQIPTSKDNPWNYKFRDYFLKKGTLTDNILFSLSAYGSRSLNSKIITVVYGSSLNSIGDKNKIDFKNEELIKNIWTKKTIDFHNNFQNNMNFKESLMVNLDTEYQDLENKYADLININKTKKTVKKEIKIKTKEKKVKVAKAEEQKKEEFKPKKINKDNDAPVIEIAETITVSDSDYEFNGKVTDQAKNIYIEVDGYPINVSEGIFTVNGYSPVDKQISIIAIDQHGNKSQPKLVNIIIDQKDTIVADLFEALNPSNIKTESNKDRVALIIGIEKYDQTPEASFANLDAKYFFDYSRKAFGVSKSNIKLLVDEDANLIKSLGTISKWLPGKIKDGETELIIFFAGHGLASSDGKELYLLSQDSDPDLLERTALSRTELFKQIISLNPKSVTMFLDTCYSGVSRDEETLLASARPVRIVAEEQEIPNNFTIFSASQLDQISSGLKEANHGIFSYYLMKGLEGKADSNQDKKITNGELLAYMDENVSQKASELGRKQNPSLAGDPDKVLMSYR